MARTFAPLMLAALLTAAGPGAAQAPDPRIAAVEQRVAMLAPYAKLPPCREKAEPARWEKAGAPDKGLARPLISAHRGGNTLAPENTLAAYEAALALGVDFIEVDIRETRDGVFIANHDDTVDRTTNGTGLVADLTLAQIRALNAADYAPWKGGPFDPSRVATLEEVLALAKKAGAGVELDVKIGNADARIAALVDRYGLTKRSFFNSQRVDALKAVPGSRLIYNRNSWEPPALLYAATRGSWVFGSRLDRFTPEAIAAIHDGCGVVMPHAYDLGGAQEAAQFIEARARGADGVQTNQPELIVGLAGLTVRSRLTRDRRTGLVCLVNAKNGMGIYGKVLSVGGGSGGKTGLHGCAAVSGDKGAVVRFRG